LCNITITFRDAFDFTILVSTYIGILFCEAIAMFQPQSSKPDFRGIQQSVSTFWSDNHIFEQSVEQRPVSDPYRFYDGPPFITGLPHYGHLASSVAKDVIPRYQTMKGKRVERVRGRDCHGIPIEQKVQKKL
jgi:isoleucyl-tRNA synthetase